ncbi:MAG: beta-eliminating lyase-related protein, partial [Candidatus Eremiobacteraeota bacterium]|nr:beta-eliminating lyase-related protein [Candidatus Eremiobacteraeota bacterium]
MSACTRTFGHLPQTARERLLEIARSAGVNERPDRYGGGAMLEEFEVQIASLLGKEAAVFMPSGTMAQQIALRLHADASGNRRVGLHPQSHLVVSEEDAYERLSGLHGTLLGQRHRLYTIADLDALKELPGSLLIELPERNIGGILRPWEDLVDIVQWARTRKIALHMDGARLWESQPFYGRSHAEIAALFDTVYVSFYKGLNGLAGAALAGPKAHVDAARLWQQRHGGRLVQLYPYVLSAREGLARYLPRMEAYRERAVQIATVLSEFERITVTPNPPHTNM